MSISHHIFWTLGISWGFLFVCFLFSWEAREKECLLELFTVRVASVCYASVYVYALGWFGIKDNFHFRDLKPFLIFSGNNGLIALSRESGSQWQHCLSKTAHSSSKTVAADLWMESVWIFDVVGNKFWPDAECGCPSLPCSGKHKQ